MIDVVFISDLHLHPDEIGIQHRFNEFVAWAKDSVKQVYILGDFFHAWAGDDTLDAWSLGIANQLMSLKNQGIKLYYMAGNRDFLLGKRFAKLCGWEVLTEPSLITLGSEKILLVHGDRYCTKDKAHQRFRRLTRNAVFSTIFLALPLTLRNRLVAQVRTNSMQNQSKTLEQMDVVVESVVHHMDHYKVHTLIHGHTHKPGLSQYQINSKNYNRYVLSDWDDTPKLLCYDNTKGFYFTQI